MSLRSLALRSLALPPAAGKRRLIFLAAALMLAGGSVAARANDFVDSGGRRVALPARIGRVMAAEPVAEVLVFALTPRKLIGWARPPQRGRQPARYARLPVIGALVGPGATATAETVKRLHPDLIVDSGPIDPAHIAFADQMQQATGVPYILVDESIPRIPGALRAIGAVLGVAARGEDLAVYGEYAIDALHGSLLVEPATTRPRVYFGRGPSGMDPALPGTKAGEALGQAGVINVAAALEQAPPPAGRPAAVTPELLRQWNPSVILAEDRGFYEALRRSPAWRGIAAVRKKAVYLVPSLPFGWIDDPAGVNRLIGLYWMSALFYPNENQEDLRSQVHDFYQKFYGITLGDGQVEGMVRAAGIPPNPTPTLGPLPPTQLPSGPGMTNYPPGRTPRGLPPLDLPNAPPTPAPR